jgi:hypothetical protein
MASPSRPPSASRTLTRGGLRPRSLNKAPDHVRNAPILTLSLLLNKFALLRIKRYRNLSTFHRKSSNLNKQHFPKF